MSPSVVAYLRSRDLEGFQAVLQSFTPPGPEDDAGVVLRCVEILLPAMRPRFLSLSGEEMRRMAMDRVAELTGSAEVA